MDFQKSPQISEVTYTFIPHNIFERVKGKVLPKWLLEWWPVKGTVVTWIDITDHDNDLCPNTGELFN